MARPVCMVDVWDVKYQELLVRAHAQDTQVVKTVDCDDKKLTGDDILKYHKKKHEIK